MGRRPAGGRGTDGFAAEVGREKREPSCYLVLKEIFINEETKRLNLRKEGPLLRKNHHSFRFR